MSHLLPDDSSFTRQFSYGRQGQTDVSSMEINGVFESGGVTSTVVRRIRRHRPQTNGWYSILDSRCEVGRQEGIAGISVTEKHGVIHEDPFG